MHSHHFILPLFPPQPLGLLSLQLWKCTGGTNKVEGGPHSDIYPKFGALHGKLEFIITMVFIGVITTALGSLILFLA
jgi:hypothetical protein